MVAATSVTESRGVSLLERPIRQATLGVCLEQQREGPIPRERSAPADESIGELHGPVRDLGIPMTAKA